MRRCRGRLGVAVMNGKLYALGGFDCAVRLKSAEVYDPETNKWSEISDMIHSRSAPACSAMNGRLYVCGGYNGESCLASCESYDPQRNVWEQLPSMQRARSAAAAICFAGQMFVTGGLTDLTDTDLFRRKFFSSKICLPKSLLMKYF